MCNRKIDIFVPGPPVSYRPPKVVRRGGRIIAYSPKAYAVWKARVAAAARAEMVRQGMSLHVGSTFCCCRAYLPRPKSLPASKRIGHVKKPDLDNIVKACLDGIKSVMIPDDNQVDFIVALKQYADDLNDVGVRIIIMTMPPFQDAVGIKVKKRGA